MWIVHYWKRLVYTDEIYKDGFDAKLGGKQNNNPYSVIYKEYDQGYNFNKVLFQQWQLGYDSAPTLL